VTAVPSLACHSAGGHRPLAGSGPWAERAAEHFVVILTNAAADLLDESGNNRRDNLSNRAPFLRELLNTSKYPFIHTGREQTTIIRGMAKPDGNAWIRRERTVMMWPARQVGGTLTLTNNGLVWERSRGWFFASGLLGDRGPKRLEFELGTTKAGPAGRLIPWPVIIFTGFGGALIGLFSGWFRKCLGVQPQDAKEAYCFAVKNVEGWLSDIQSARALKRSDHLTD